MADKQYTFRTTKSTEWLEEHLDNMENRSTFLRKCVLYAIEHDPKLSHMLSAHIPSEKTSEPLISSHQRTEKPTKPKEKVSHQRPHIRESDKSASPQIRESKPKVLVSKETDLDKALSSKAIQFQ